VSMYYYYEAVCRSDSFDFSEWDEPEIFEEEQDAQNLATACCFSYVEIKYLESENLKLWYDKNGPFIAITKDSTIEDYRKIWAPIAYKS
jgi:hypothetical protein